MSEQIRDRVRVIRRLLQHCDLNLTAIVEDMSRQSMQGQAVFIQPVVSAKNSLHNVIMSLRDAEDGPL